MSDIRRIVESRLEAAREAIEAFGRDSDQLVRISETVVGILETGGTIITCGNGGSAAEALHLSEELIGRFARDRPPLRSLCLNADPTALTCIGNDYGFDEVFARQCTALAGPADALIVFSTSGRSTNIIKALQAARDNAATTIGLLGGDGGGAAELCDHVLMAPGSDSASIQECHQVALHAICNCLEP